MLSPNLRLNRVLAPVFNLGPGRRIGVWVQGCTLGCEGCISPTLWPAHKGSLVDVSRLLDTLDTVDSAATGITITGGEPFEQYEGLLALASGFKRVRGGDVLVYSGYRLEELEGLYPQREFLHCIDWLIDGRYEASSPSSDGVRGSTNQRVWRIDDGLACQTPLAATAQTTISVSVTESSVFLSGVPKPGELRSLEAQLKAAGLPLRFTK